MKKGTLRERQKNRHIGRNILKNKQERKWKRKLVMWRLSGETDLAIETGHINSHEMKSFRFVLKLKKKKTT